MTMSSSNERKDVNALFGETSRKVKRSLMLLSEKSPSSSRAAYHEKSSSSSTSHLRGAGTGATSSAPPSAVPPPPAPPLRPISSLGQTLASLRAIAEFVDFLDTTATIQPRLVKEKTDPSPAIKKQRENRGIRFALTRKWLPLLLVDDLPAHTPRHNDDDHSPRSAKAAMGARGQWGGELEGVDDGPCSALWGFQASSAAPLISEEEAEEVTIHSRSNATRPLSRRCCGASVSALLLTACICADTLHAAARADSVAQEFFAEMGMVERQSTGSPGLGRRDGHEATAAAANSTTTLTPTNTNHAFQWWLQDDLSPLLHSLSSRYPEVIWQGLLQQLAVIYLRGEGSPLQKSIRHGASSHSAATDGTAATANVPMDSLPSHGMPVLPVGPTLFPCAISSLLCFGASQALVDTFVEPLSRCGAGILSTFFEAEAKVFEVVCRRFVHHVLLGVYAVAGYVKRTTMNSLRQGNSREATASSLRALLLPQAKRGLLFLRQLIHSVVGGLERSAAVGSGGEGIARAAPGLSEALYTYLVRPLCGGLQQTLRDLAEEGVGHTSSSGADGLSALSMTLRTAMYRVWLVLEDVGRAELSRSGASSEHAAAASRKRHRRLLQASGGKMTIAVLKSVAEEQQLLVEESNTRSPSGHQLFKIHPILPLMDGKKTFVFVYVESGSVFYKVGRSPSFQLAQSVEELFKPFS